VYKKDNGTCACGFFLERGLYWRQAADRCYALSARLPEIKSVRENTDIYNLMVNLVRAFLSKTKHKKDICNSYLALLERSRYIH
jgi:hypothetical protein